MCLSESSRKSILSWMNSSDHFNGETFFNPTQDKPTGGLGSALRMLLTSPRARWPKRVENQAIPRLKENLQPGDVAITFVNHATFLLQTPEANILTDPVWSQRTSPSQFLGPARVREPGIAFGDLPRIDLILLSHNHYDHLDLATLKKLRAKFDPTICVAMGDRRVVKGAGFSHLEEFDWWQSSQVLPTVKVTFAPTQHFSARTPWDRNHSLWGSYLIETHGRKIYFGGDAGYSRHYTEIYRRLGAPDISLLGIGAYEPNWFMKPMHMNPAEAVRAHQDLNSHLSIGMHFGTFQLSSEAIDQPVIDLKRAMAESRLPPEAFVTLHEGETRVMRGR